MDGKVIYFVVGVGIGGIIFGVGKYLKEKNLDVKVWGIDMYGLVFKKYKEIGIFDENEIYLYIMEGIGEDIFFVNVDFDVIDYFEKVIDKDVVIFIWKLVCEEGIFVGNFVGVVIVGLL